MNNSVRTRRFAEVAETLLAKGFHPLPVKPGMKRVEINGWSSVPIVTDTVRAWISNGYGGYDVGLRCGTVIGIDIDVTDEDVTRQIRESFELRFGRVPYRIGTPPKVLLMCRTDTPFSKMKISWEAGASRHAVEVLAQGQQFVVYGSPNQGKNVYSWQTQDEPLTVAVDKLRLVTPEALKSWLLHDLPALVPSQWIPKGDLLTGDGAVYSVASNDDGVIELPMTVRGFLGWSLAEASELLGAIDPDCPYEDWLNICFGLHYEFQGSEDAFHLFDAWSSKGSKYAGDADTRLKWDSCRGGYDRGRGPVTGASIIALADRHRQADAIMDAVEVEIEWRKTLEAAQDERTLASAVAEIVKARLDATIVHKLVPAYRKRFKELTGLAVDISAAKAMFFPQVRHDALPDALADWVFLQRTNEFFRRSDCVAFDVNSFNNQLAHALAEFDMLPNRVAMREFNLPQYFSSMYHPAWPSEFEHLGRRYVNSYRKIEHDKSVIKLHAARQALEAYKRHLILLIRDPRERNLLLMWLRHAVTKPGVKIRWAIMLKGCQGDGKNSLIDLAGCVLGPENYQTTQGDTLINSTFTSWGGDAALRLLNEVKLPGHSNADIYNRLKPFISDDVVEVHKKNRDAVNVPNVTNYVALTNHVDGLYMDDTDRRFFVVHSDYSSQPSFESALLADYDLSRDEYFDQLHELKKYPAMLEHFFLDDELVLTKDERAMLSDEVVRAWAAEFKVNGIAPDTRAKHHTIAANKSDLRVAIEDCIDTGGRGVTRTALAVGCLCDMLRARGLAFEDKQVGRILSGLPGWQHAGRALVKDSGKQTFYTVEGIEARDAKVVPLLGL